MFTVIVITCVSVSYSEHGKCEVNRNKYLYFCAGHHKIHSTSNWVYLFVFLCFYVLVVT